MFESVSSDMEHDMSSQAATRGEMRVQLDSSFAEKNCEPLSVFSSVRPFSCE